MRRLCAVLLSAVMLFSCVPVQAMMETVYAYPQVKAYILPNGSAIDEYEFRKWAAEVITEYFLRYVGCDDEDRSFEEYWRMAQTKLNFDKVKGSDEIIYHSLRLTESQNDSLYIWVFLESLKETMRINADRIMNAYLGMDKSERKYVMVNITEGNLKVDQIVADTQKASQDISTSKWLKAGADILLTALDVALEYKVVLPQAGEDGSDLMSSVINGVIETVDSVAEACVDIGKTNALNEIDNLVREQLIEEMASAVLNVNYQTVRYLEATYDQKLNSAWSTNYEGMIHEFLVQVNPDRNPMVTQHILEEVRKKIDSDEAATAVMDSMGYAVLDAVGWDTAIAIVILNSVKTVLTEAIDVICDEIEDSMNSNGATQIEINAKRIKATDFIEALGKSLAKVVESSVDGAINQCLENTRNGKEEAWRTVTHRVGDELVTKFVSGSWGKDFLSRCVGILIAGGITKGAIKYGSIKTDNEVDMIVAEFVQSILQYGGTQTVDGLLNAKYDWGGFEKTVLASFGKLYKKDIEIGKKEIDNKIAQSRNKDEINVLNSISQNWPDLDKEDAQGRAKDLQNEIKKQEELSDDLGDKHALLGVVMNVFDRCWETGGSIRNALDSQLATMNGEGRVSLLAMRIVTAQKMCHPLFIKLNNSIVDLQLESGKPWSARTVYDCVMDPEQISIEELFDLVSTVNSQIKYDIVGTSSYWNIVMHLAEYYGFNSNRIEKEDGSIDYKGIWWSHTKFTDYVADHHQNIDGKQGFLHEDRAEQEYNSIVTYSNGTIKEWKPEWDLLLQ